MSNAVLHPCKMKVVYTDGGRAAAGFTGKHGAGDCVCRAIAIASGRPYREIYDALADINVRTPKSKRRKRGKFLGQRTASNGIFVQSKFFKDYMQSIGFVWTPTMKIGSGCKVHLVRDELPMGRLVVSVSKHYTAVIDRVIYDTHDPQRDESFFFEPDVGQPLKTGQFRRGKSVVTKIGGRCVYGYWTFPDHLRS